jgi:type IV secretion system T-DNA border endonuclease VirD1
MQNADEHRALFSHTQPDQEQYKIVSIRLRYGEYEALDQQARALGLTNSMAVRIAIRRIGGFLEIDPEMRHSLQAAVQAIGDVSASLSELAKACAAGERLDQDALAQQRVLFGKEFATLDGLLRRVLNISQSRIDGMLLLKDILKREQRMQ